MKIQQVGRVRYVGLLGVAVLSIGVGIVAGRIARLEGMPTEAASNNITVDNNDQSVSVDQSTGIATIVQTSVVTVRNLEADYGYTLSAKIGQNTLTGATVTVGSASSTECPVNDSCALNNTNSTIILTTDNNEATQVDGDTTTFTVTITIPAGAGISDYTLDIEYQEEANEVFGLVEGANMQEVTKEVCDETPTGTIVNLKDTRDNTYYRVKKMPDGNCWMVDNLAYDINSAPAQGKPAYNPAPALISGTTTSVDTRAQYILNNNIAGQGQIPNNGSPKASYLYNWCAIIGDTSANCTASKNAADLQTVLNGKATTTATATDQPEVQGICPAPFRLPKGGPVANPANDGTNTATALSSTANEFVRLDIAMDGLGTNRSSANTYPNFTGTTTDQKDWFGAFSGSYYSTSYYQGSRGNWRSSTAYGTTFAYSLDLTQGVQGVSPASNGGRANGLAVRCLL